MYIYSCICRCMYGAVLAAAVLQHELSVPAGQRKQCTRFLRLAAQGDVDATRTEANTKSNENGTHERSLLMATARADD